MIVASASTGGVASGDPRAAAAGLQVLADGGSSVDAALAMAFAQWVVNSPLCGPGGDLVVLHVSGGSATVHSGWSRVPRAFPADGPVETDGPRAAVVPGALAGAEQAWRVAGRLPWRRLFADACRLAAGHEVTPWMARSYASVHARGHVAALGAILDVDDVPRAGDSVRATRLGRSLQVLADDGAEAIRHGVLAGAIADAARADGAHLSAADLADVTGHSEPATTVDLGDMSLAYLPPPSQAGIIADLLGAVGPDLDPGEAPFAAAVAPITRDQLIARCVVGMPGTAASIASDGESAAVVVHSLAGVQHGTGWVAGETGIALGNRVGTALSTRPDLPAANPSPGAVLPHTLSAAWFSAVDRSLLIATPGGDRQVQWVAQAGQRFRRGEPLESVVAGPRWFVCPEGDRFGVPGGIGKEWFLFAEPGIAWHDQAELASFQVRQMESVGGGLQAAMFEDGVWHMGSDPHSDGTALVQGAADV